jgi:NADH dehydrogenase [ubiquinone] 1 alpha subcomplex assembly factor 7
MSLSALIQQQIKKHGPITIADYMQLALQHPDYGYYTRNDPLGAKGDFTTAPEISQIFGELIGAWLATQWMESGKPGMALVELGPGHGTLMADILRATRKIPDFHDALSVHMVETSPTLKQKQWSTLAGAHINLHWHDGLDTVPDRPLLLVANEFFDALPIRQYVHTAKGWQERMVTLDKEGKLTFIMVSAKPPATLKELPVSENIYEYSEPSIEVMQMIGTRLKQRGGAALIIDYGYTGGTRADTLQAVKAHNFHPVLETPGAADLSAHVDFDALAGAAVAQGAIRFPVATQGRFLERLGAELRLKALCKDANAAQKSAMISGLERLTSPDAMGELFKALCVAHPEHPHPDGF